MLPLFSGYTDTLLRAGVSLVSYSLHHYNHHLANMDLRHLWTRSGLTHPKVSLMFSPGFFCPLVCIFYYPRQSNKRHTVDMLQLISSVFLHFVQTCGYIESFSNYLFDL